MRRTIAFAGAASLIAVGLAASPAFADPKPAGQLTLDCGTPIEVTVAGNGQWTPAHDLGSTSVYQPVGFGAFTGTVYDGDGNVLDNFIDPSEVFKGGKRVGQGTPLECSFQGVEGPGYDPYFDQDVTFVYSGTVFVQTKKS